MKNEFKQARKWKPEDAKLLTNAYPVRRLNADEIQSALDLTWEVFLQFEAPEYSKEGIDFFRASLDDEERTRALKFTVLLTEVSWWELFV